MQVIVKAALLYWNASLKISRRMDSIPEQTVIAESISCLRKGYHMRAVCITCQGLPAVPLSEAVSPVATVPAGLLCMFDPERWRLLPEEDALERAQELTSELQLSKQAMRKGTSIRPWSAARRSTGAWHACRRGRAGGCHPGLIHRLRTQV